MVQPIQYQIPGVSPDPFAGVLQGLKIGATLSELDAARATQALKQQELQRKMEQQRLANEAFSKFRDIPFNQAKSSDIAGLLGYAPAEMINALTKLKENQTAEQNANAARNYGQMLSAVKSGNPQEAINLANTLAEGATDEATKQGYRALARGFEKAPDAAAKQIALAMYGLGDKYVDIAKKILDQEDQGAVVISSAADKLKNRLTTSEGQPLPGTFVRTKEGGWKLLEGQKAGFSIMTTDEANRRNLPTNKGQVYQINKDNNKVELVDTRMLVKVDVGTSKPTAFQQELDKKFAPIAVDWMAGEKSLAASRINQLDAVVNVLETKKRITGPVLGLTPDIVLAFVNPASREARANAERVLQEGLRAVLGGQFTRPEGEAFLARSYDPKAPQEDNARRLRAVVRQMKESAKDRDAMLKYVQGPGKGSLVGFTGRVPTIADFYAAIDEKPPEEASATPATPPQRRVEGRVTSAAPTTPAVDYGKQSNQQLMQQLMQSLQSQSDYNRQTINPPQGGR